MIADENDYPQLVQAFVDAGYCERCDLYFATYQAGDERLEAAYRDALSQTDILVLAGMLNAPKYGDPITDDHPDCPAPTEVLPEGVVRATVRFIGRRTHPGQR